MRVKSVKNGMVDLYFDDLRKGQIFDTPTHTITRPEILAFAEEFDPNPFHLGDSAAVSAGLPSLIASGFHTLSLSFRLFFELHLWDAAVMPSPGLDKVRWLKPLLPGQTIRVRATVLETLSSKSKPDRGIVRMAHETFETSSNEAILYAEAMHRLRRRDALLSNEIQTRDTRSLTGGSA
jgi:acyl dehydratase